MGLRDEIEKIKTTVFLNSPITPEIIKSARELEQIIHAAELNTEQMYRLFLIRDYVYKQTVDTKPAPCSVSALAASADTKPIEPVPAPDINCNHLKSVAYNNSNKKYRCQKCGTEFTQQQFEKHPNYAIPTEDDFKASCRDLQADLQNEPAVARPPQNVAPAPQPVSATPAPTPAVASFAPPTGQPVVPSIPISQPAPASWNPSPTPTVTPEGKTVGFVRNGSTGEFTPVRRPGVAGGTAPAVAASASASAPAPAPVAAPPAPVPAPVGYVSDQYTCDRCGEDDLVLTPSGALASYTCNRCGHQASFDITPEEAAEIAAGKPVENSNNVQTQQKAIPSDSVVQTGKRRGRPRKSSPEAQEPASATPPAAPVTPVSATPATISANSAVSATPIVLEVLAASAPPVAMEYAKAELDAMVKSWDQATLVKNWENLSEKTWPGIEQMPLAQMCAEVVDALLCRTSDQD